MKKAAFCILLFLGSFSSLLAQDTLPNFSVRNAGNNRIIIGWNNTFETVKQISIQRSFDSLKNYKTILTVADPTTPQNGFVDTKATNDHMFYRLYILLDRGVYLFSDPKRPVPDTANLGMGMPGDKLPLMTIDTILVDPITKQPTIVKKPVAIPAFIPSRYIYTYKDGYVRISLPENPEKKYSIRFFTAEDEPLFELKDLKERSFRLDKSNFYKAGWYKFELYENGELLEKHKFYLTKEF